MSNRKYCYIFRAVISSGNILSQSLTGLYNLKIRLTVTRAPEMMHCLGRLQVTSRGEVKDYMDVSCDESQSEAYTGIKANQLRVRLCVIALHVTGL